MANPQVRFLFEEIMRLFKPIAALSAVLLGIMTLQYSFKPNLINISVTIKESSYVSEGKNSLGSATSLLDTITKGTSKSENLKALQQIMISRLVAERLLSDPNPELQAFMSGFEHKQPNIVMHIVRSILNIKSMPLDRAQLVADFIKSAVTFEENDDILSIKIDGIDRELGYLLLNKLLYYADLVHYENSQELVKYAQQELNNVFAQTQDLNVRKFLISQIYNKVISSLSIKPEPPYFYTVLYPPSHVATKTVRGYALRVGIILVVVIAGAAFTVVFIQPYLNERRGIAGRV